MRSTSRICDEARLPTRLVKNKKSTRGQLRNNTNELCRNLLQTEWFALFTEMHFVKPDGAFLRRNPTAQISLHWPTSSATCVNINYLTLIVAWLLPLLVGNLSTHRALISDTSEARRSARLPNSSRARTRRGSQCWRGLRPHWSLSAWQVKNKVAAWLRRGKMKATTDDRVGIVETHSDGGNSAKVSYSSAFSLKWSSLRVVSTMLSLVLLCSIMNNWPGD